MALDCNTRKSNNTEHYKTLGFFHAAYHKNKKTWSKRLNYVVLNGLNTLQFAHAIAITLEETDTKF